VLSKSYGTPSPGDPGHAHSKHFPCTCSICSELQVEDVKLQATFYMTSTSIHCSEKSTYIYGNGLLWNPHISPIFLTAENPPFRRTVLAAKLGNPHAGSTVLMTMGCLARWNSRKAPAEDKEIWEIDCFVVVVAVGVVVVVVGGVVGVVWGIVWD
jgi:hypothetical protein